MDIEPPMPAFPPPVPMGPTPDDIMQMVREAIEFHEAEVEKETRPRYPKWLKMAGEGKNEHPVAYPRPDPDETLARAKDIWNEYASYRARAQDDLAFITGVYGGTVFADADDDEKENPYRESMVQAEHPFLIATIGAIDPIYQPEGRKLADADESSRKADFLYAADREAERRHISSGNGPLRADVVNTELLYGRIAAQVIYDTDCDDGEVPVRFALLDPSTCAPVFEGDRGMEIMVRNYVTTLGEAAAAFNYDGEFRKKLKENRGWSKKCEDKTSVEVIEWWDRWWRFVWVDSILIVGPIAHKFGEPPHIYQMGVMGLPGNVNQLSVVRDGKSYESRRNAPIPALPYKGLSFAHLLRQPVALREAMYSRMLTEFRRAIDPAYLVHQDHIADEKGVPEISRKPNAVNTALRGHEDITTLPAGNGPDNTFVTLMQGVNDQLGRLMAPAAAYGIGEAGNGSGFALENLNENGRDKFTPHVMTVQMFYVQLAEKRLRMAGDWGWMLQQGDGKYGEFELSRPKPLPFEEPGFTITAREIRRTGYRCDVRMTKPRMQSWSQITNALAIMRNIGMGNPVYFWEVMGHPNPERAVMEDRYWQMMNDPALQRIDLIDHLKRNGQLDKAAYLQAQADQEKAGGMLPTDQLSAGASMQEPIGAQAQGMSMPQFNQPPGPVQ